MTATPSARHFGYRSPRYNFPGKLRVELRRAGSTYLLEAEGIDICAEGIAVAVHESIPLGAPVLVAIRLGEEMSACVAGRVFRQSGQHCSIAFEHASAEQWEQIHDLLSAYTKDR